MSDNTLIAFIEKALGTGASRVDVEKALVEAGWPKHQIKDALNAFSSVDFPVPVPAPKVHFSARDTFLYLVMFGMLYLSAYNLGGLLFQFINLAFPDPAFERLREYAYREIRFSVSAIIVAFPAFLLLSVLIERQIREEPALRLSAIRKWLVYLTLAVAACVIAGDLIYLLNNLLSGELTARFVLKVIVVGLISTSVFFYYLSATRDDERIVNQ